MTKSELKAALDTAISRLDGDRTGFISETTADREPATKGDIAQAMLSTSYALEAFKTAILEYLS